MTTRLTMAFLLVASLAACVAPFSELQSARLAGRGVVEVTPSYSYVDGSSEGESAKLQDNFGVQVATGLTDRMDLRLRIENMKVDVNDPNFDFSATAIGVGPKIALIPDRLALFLPVGFASGGDIDQSQTWQFHPSLIWTIPVAAAFEVNSSVKALVPLSGGDNNNVLAALNVGLGIGPDLSRWAIRPEFGILKNPGESETARQFTLGATFYLGRK